jgi:polyhydroxyalkanoate synthesis regulator phasin
MELPLREYDESDRSHLPPASGRRLLDEAGTLARVYFEAHRDAIGVVDRVRRRRELPAIDAVAHAAALGRPALLFRSAHRGRGSRPGRALPGRGCRHFTVPPCYAGRKMSSIKKTLVKQGMKLMTDPRVMKVMQDERVMKAVMQMMSMPGKVQSFTTDQVERLAKAMSLATEDEVKDLKRQIRRLEEEVTRLEKEKKRG